MKRNFTLARKVLEFVEERGSRRYKGPVPIEGYERDEVIYHLELLADAGYVNLGPETLTHKGVLVLTWKGCDYLDELRAADHRQTPQPKPAAPNATAPRSTPAAPPVVPTMPPSATQPPAPPNVMRR